MSSTLQQSWLIQSLVGTLMGEPSTGEIMVGSTGASGTLPAGSVGIPVIGGSLSPDRAVMVEPSPDPPVPGQDAGSWALSPSPLAVGVTSVLGGVGGDLEPGTPVRWIPPVPGVEDAEVGPSGLTGGTRSESYGALRQVRLYQDLDPVREEAFFLAQLHDYPAAALTWERTIPADGSGGGNIGARSARATSRGLMVQHFWALYLVSSRLDGSDQRAREGATIRDALYGILQGRHAWRGLPLSHPTGLDIVSARMARVTPTSYVDEIVFATMAHLSRCELGPDDWAEWRTTRIAADRDGLPIVDATDPMPPWTPPPPDPP